MTPCTIIIKIKDYFPKIDSIPYQNFICLFTCEENEGQLPLISQEKENIQHQMKVFDSDIKYKVHVLDYNDMSLIGMCEMVIPYNIISQIKPPNGFIQEQQKKLLMDVNTKRKLFGTVLSVGDIYINIYSEIYLCEMNNTNNINQKNYKSVTRRKKMLSANNKKIDGSPKTVKKKKLIMKMNSDRQALMNINKNNLNNLTNLEMQNKYNSNRKGEKNEKNPIKPNNSFNYKEIQINKNSIINLRENKNKQKSMDRKDNNIKAKKSKDKTKINMKYNKDNITNKNNILNRVIKTETNKNHNNRNGNNQREKLLQNKNLNKKNIFMDNKTVNELENKTNIELNKIGAIDDLYSKKYISKSKSKEKIVQKKEILIGTSNTSNRINSIDKIFNDIDRNIFDKGNEIRNNFTSQLNEDNNKDNKNNNEIVINQNNNENRSNENENQLLIKNNMIQLIDFYSLLSNKLQKIHHKNLSSSQKYNIYKEKLFNELKKNNILTQKKTVVEIKNFLNVNNHSALNEKFLREMIKVKKSEFKIYQNIFNLFYYEYDILKWKEQEKSMSLEQKAKIELLLVVFKNLLKNYGNVSHIFMYDESKKEALKNCLTKYNLIEKENDEKKNSFEKKEDNKMKISDDLNRNKFEDKNNKNEMDKFKVINEVDEEKEDEMDEEDKYDFNTNIYNNNYQISCNSSNSKNNINSSLFNSNKKLKSNTKNKSTQKKIVENETINTKNEISIEPDKTNLNKNAITPNNLNRNTLINKNNHSYNKYINEEKNKINENIDFKGEEDNNDIKKKIDMEKMSEIDENTSNSNENMDIIKNSKNKNEEKEKKKEEKQEHFLNENEQKKKNIELYNNKYNINEIMTNNIDSEKDEIKSIKKEKKNNEISDKKEFIMEKEKENERDNVIIKEEEKENENNDDKKEINNSSNSKNKIYTKNRIKKEKKNKEKKEKYDEEDLIIQKLLIEEFPKKCKEENIFIRISKYVYSFGEEKIKVELEGDDVVLKLDEGDYKLQEFIEILNEGKEEDNENENENEEIKDLKEDDIEVEEENTYVRKKRKTYDKDYNNSPIKKNIESANSESSEKKNKRKRRKKRVNVESEDEEENKENEEKNEKDSNKKENKDRKYSDKENYDDNFQENFDSNNEEKFSGKKDFINENQNNNKIYSRKKRKDYKF